MRAQAIRRVLAALVGMTSGLMVVPAALSLLFEDGAFQAFASSAVVLALLGLAGWWPVRNVRYELRVRDGFLITVGAWILCCLAGALPFMLAPPYLGLAPAVFESVSGLTTTGGTVITFLDELPRSVLFYRQSLNFIGGMGIIVLAVAILPMLKVGGMQLFSAEKSGGPTRDTKLTPRVKETAKALWAIYLGLNVACAFAYWVAGMDWFDAIGHAFSTVATAGFSTHDASIGYYDSPLIEFVAIVFMLVGATNFAMHFFAWRHGTASHYPKDPELKALVLVIAGVAVFTTVGLVLASHYDSVFESWRHALFHTVSHITTTGFATTNSYSWPPYLALSLLLVAFIGGCAGSTAGGLKVVRIVVLFRHGMREMVRLVHPRAELAVKLGGHSVPDVVLLAVLAHLALMLASLVVFSIAIAATGQDLVSAVSAAASGLTNLGPALGVGGPHYADFSATAQYLLSLAMILGRLELFTLLVVLTPAFWKS